MRTFRAALFLPWIFGCQPAQEAPRVELPLVVDESGMGSLTTDLGYEVTLSAAQMVVRDFQFTTAGELHATSLPRTLWAYVVPPALAHPGHYEGGEVIGEAPGRFFVDWFDEGRREIGKATLILGSYTAANFTFGRAEEDDQAGDDDTLLGHTARFVGVAGRDGQDIDFEIVLDSPADRVLAGAPFAAEITEDSEVRIGFGLLPLDEIGGGTLFDGVDFAELDMNEDGEVFLYPSSEQDVEVDAYNVIHRAFQTHNHYGFRAIPADDE